MGVARTAGRQHTRVCMVKSLHVQQSCFQHRTRSESLRRIPRWMHLTICKIVRAQTLGFMCECVCEKAQSLIRRLPMGVNFNFLGKRLSFRRLPMDELLTPRFQLSVQCFCAWEVVAF